MAQQRGRRKPKSEYGLQLEEKQTLKRTYGLREKKFRRYFDEGKDPEIILQKLELRLDNVVFRSGIAYTRKFARQLVNHGHVQLNGRNVDLPSLQVKIGDVISIHPSSKNIIPFKDLSLTLKKHEAPEWISLNKKDINAKIVASPQADEFLIASSIRPIIEFYSR